MLVAYVFNSDFGANKEGDIVQLDPETAQALVDAGVISEATQEHVNGGEAGEEEANEEAAPVLTRSFNKQIQDTIVKATELAVSKVARAESSFKVPATIKEDTYKGIGDVMVDLYRTKASNSSVANRARNRLAAYDREYRLKAPLGMNEGTNADGGYGVKPEWMDSIFEKVHDYPHLIDMTEKIPAGSNALNIPAINETGAADGVRHGGTLAYYVGEGNAATSSYSALTQVSLSVKTLVILQYVTLQLLQDANIEGIESIIRRQAALEMLWQQNEAVVNGSGSGQPKGILNQAALKTTSKSSSTAAAKIGFDDLANMYRNMYPPSRNKAVFLVNPECYGVLLTMLFPNNASTSVYPAWSLSYNGHDEFPMKIFGRPVLECMNLPQLGAAGDIIFADLSQLVTYERPQIQIDSSEHLQFNTLQVAFRFVYRFDINSPWTSVYTSKDGAYSYSPFVCLQSRGT